MCAEGSDRGHFLCSGASSLPLLLYLLFYHDTEHLQYDATESIDTGGHGQSIDYALHVQSTQSGIDKSCKPEPQLTLSPL
ncbi:hypothetical protein BST61_g9989 [Cercospora zeina]